MSSFVNLIKMFFVLTIGVLFLVNCDGGGESNDNSSPSTSSNSCNNSNSPNSNELIVSQNTTGDKNSQSLFAEIKEKNGYFYTRGRKNSSYVLMKLDSNRNEIWSKNFGSRELHDLVLFNDRILTLDSNKTFTIFNEDGNKIAEYDLRKERGQEKERPRETKR